MKKHLLITLFISITVFAKAQQYPPLLNNTEWYVGASCPFVGFSSDWYYVTNDTIINGATYKKYNHPNSTYEWCLREDTTQKKVWINKNSQDKLLYDFNLTVGDTFIFEQVSFIVAADDTISTCSGQRRRLKFDPIPGQWSAPREFICVEGIGSFFDPFALFFRGYPFDQCDNFLICSHQDNSVTYDSAYTFGNTTFFCPEVCSNTTSIMDTNNVINFHIYPNPFSSVTVLQTDIFLNNASLSVKNIFGKTVSEVLNLNGMTINFDRDNLSGGLYFVKLIQDNKIIKTEKFIITD